MDANFETVQADTNSSFRSLWFTCTSFAEDHTWHYHPELELTYIIKSEGTRFIGDSIEPYAPGDLVLVGPNLPHCWHDEHPKQSRTSGPELIVLQFSSEALGRDFLSLPELAGVRQLFKASGSGLHVQGATAKRVQKRMEGVFDAQGFSRLLCLLEILEWMAHSPKDLRKLASAQYRIEKDITEANRRRIELIHRYVRENLAREISQAEIAALTGLTPAGFSRFFRQATGHTFMAFVNRLRISQACRALMESDESVTEIALTCGYNNMAHFNRQFLALKGMNPTQFRNQRDRLKAHRTVARRPQQAVKSALVLR